MKKIFRRGKNKVGFTAGSLLQVKRCGVPRQRKIRIRSDEGLTLETSAFQSLYSGQFTLSTPLINKIFKNTFCLMKYFIPRVIQSLLTFESMKSLWKHKERKPFKYRLIHFRVCVTIKNLIDRNVTSNFHSSNQFSNHHNGNVSRKIAFFYLKSKVPTV